MEINIQSPLYLEHNVFVELGLVDLPFEQKQSLLDQMNELVHKRVLLRLVEVIPAESTDQLTSVVDQGDEAVMEVLVTLVPNLPSIIVEEVDGVKDHLRTIVVTELAQ